MIVRLSRFALCGCLIASLGCQNPANRSDKFADRDTLGASLSFSSDDPAGLESGRGHLPSLASEMADYRHQSNADKTTGIPGGSPATVQRLLERGHDADAHGRTQEAKMYYQQVLVEDPDQPDAHHRLAILADRAGSFPLAERHYQEALRGKPNDADVLNDLGYSYFLQGRAADSERYLTLARQIDPKHPHVSENLSLLYDAAKAEKVLLTVMAPRQTQATLAQLFANSPMNDRSPPGAPIEGSEMNMARQTPGQFAGQAVPETMQSLQQKMEEARLRSIAERQQRNSPGQQPAVSDRSGGLPPLPPNYPQHIPPRLAQAAIDEVPDARINDAFRSIDRQGQPQRSSGQYHAQRESAPRSMPPAYEPGRLPDVQAMPLPPSRHVAEQRAQAPEWNTPPGPWPQTSQQAASVSPIEQTSHRATHSARPILSSAAQRAAEIGMAAGPGSIFPPLSDAYDSSQPPQGPLPTQRQLPGTNSRINGSMYHEPGGHGVPADWQEGDSARQQNGAWGQPPERTGVNLPPNRSAQDPYDQMRARHNAQFNHDQESLAAQPGLLSNGPPAREPMPASYDPDRQDWPAYTREQYDTRQMDMPPQSEPGGYSGQTVPEFQPATQQAPQNYGRSW